MSTQFPFLDTKWVSSHREQHDQLEGGDYLSVLSSQAAKTLLSLDPALDAINNAAAWDKILDERIQKFLREEDGKESLFLIGLAAFQAFLQSNVTGPPLTFRPTEVIFPGAEDGLAERLQKALIRSLGVDGEAVFTLTPHIELFYLAKRLLNNEEIFPSFEVGAWARLRINFWHQRMLDEYATSLQEEIYEDLAFLEGVLLAESSSYSTEAKSLFLLERVAIHIYHGLDKRVRPELDEVSRLRRFQYILTGRLGKRTKFQQHDLSQLVVLAKSNNATTMNGHMDAEANVGKEANGSAAVPEALELNDDTLLERFSFATKAAAPQDPNAAVPQALLDLDPANQPMLDPIDATILLSFVSSITNTSPEDGLTREETRPYAVRVIEGGSSNWQVYTQALLVRSRIEGYKSRTVERGVLQLQALVDQIIAETGEGGSSAADGESATTFLPRPKPSEAAPVSERLKYIHQLSTPPRWALEAELASRWAALGGLRTALEIYERLEMWAEASLCLASTDEEGKAIRMVRKQLYLPKYETNGTTEGDHKPEEYNGAERSPLPTDAARLWCILGDFEQDPSHYERAWEVSKSRYARAQRSLGKYYTRQRKLASAAKAYSKALSANPQDAATWFALGCIGLSLEEWCSAVIAFQRSVHLEAEDGEAWSNLAAALLHLPPEESVASESTTTHEMINDDEEPSKPGSIDQQRHTRAAFTAFKRAAALKRDSYRIWQNVLNSGARLAPPPYADLLVAQGRLIDLRSAAEGEGCVDVEILEGILAHLIAARPTEAADTAAQADSATSSKHGIGKMLSELFHKRVTPLITHSQRLWQLAARLALWENKPSAALDAYEKAWRTTLNQPGWDDASTLDDKAWRAVQDATEELVAAYENLGEREVTEGLKGGSGALVCSNWRFKARSAIRAVVGRRVKAGAEDEGIDVLRKRMEDLKA